MSIFNNDFFSESRLQNSPNNMSLSNQPGTPRDDGEMGGNFLNPFQSESVSISLTVLLCTESLKRPYQCKCLHLLLLMFTKCSIC